MEVRNCKGCGRLFNYLAGPPLCSSCAAALDEKFSEVKEYVYDHPGVGIQEVSEEMDVPVGQIRQWIREERLAFADDSMIGLECEGCGITIKTGRFCKACKDKMAKGFSDIYSEPKTPQINKDPRTGPKMNFVSKEFKKEL
jgi:hypothetical protein